ncbi:hypothetical protein [Pseudoalteromonas rubra]|uniref:Uncharacterized protein n=1 Tax=Pseudoalteromonas rubra TaxID=43658 RepID=A0A0U2X919_9GAMM|nr:hypothetical protein [Pseudoalteromonas rubra]ALU44388.1 hypothetical protein AT705_16385 [Pseudoalteromonas rubra]
MKTTIEKGEAVSMFLCKAHVVIKNLLAWDKREKYPGVVAGAFWLNMVMQSIVYFAYTYSPFNGREGLLDLDTIKVLALSAFAFSVIIFYFSIRNEEKYQQEEYWFTNKSEEEQTFIKVSVGCFMLITFFTGVISVVYHT